MNTPTKLTVARILMTIVMIFMLLFPFYDVVCKGIGDKYVSKQNYTYTTRNLRERF